MIKLKVCGMRDSANIAGLLELKPDYMGFIFYEKSPRYVGGQLDKILLQSFPSTTAKVGVFVNESLDAVLDKVEKYSLDLVQLHGHETPAFCESLAEKGIRIIKVFGVGDSFDFETVQPFKPYSEFFLFDTKTKAYGGAGVTFDWDLLNGYDNEIPFFLSGGLSLENIRQATQMKHLNIHAIDVNSKFELNPGLKDLEKIKQLITDIKH